MSSAPQGIIFPPSSDGKRSTQEAGRDTFHASMAAVDADLAAKVKITRNWRFGYVNRVVEHVERGLKSPEDALTMARAGLEHVHNNFEFTRGEETLSVAEAMAKFTAKRFHTGFVKGEGKRPSSFEFNVPYAKYPNHGEMRELRGQELLSKLDKWVENGTIEPSSRDAIAAVVENPDWCDLSDCHVVLLGAGSAMGPLQVLLDHGANVIALDFGPNKPLRPPATSADIWKRLIGMTRKSCGTITFPLDCEQSECNDDDELFSAAGCDFFQDAPEIRTWLLDVAEGEHLTIGGYAYLDGAKHVQVSLAMDAIMAGVMEKRNNISLGFLCSPTDCFARQPEAAAAAQANYSGAPIWQKLIRACLLGKRLKPNTRKEVAESGLSVVNGVISAQGPNYALAKRIQHWRAMVARDEGAVVSSNIAPSTATASVVHNKQFAAAYGGWRFFPPLEVMFQETSNAVMGALLIHDIRNEDAASHPSYELENPLQLFQHGSFHGGIWRSAYQIGSTAETTVILYHIANNAVLIFIVLLAAAYGYLNFL